MRAPSPRPPDFVRIALLALACATAVLVAGFTAAPGIHSAARGEPTEDPHTVEWVCDNAPGRVHALFDGLDLDRPDLAAIKQAVHDRDYPAACTALLDYYQATATARRLARAPAPVYVRGGRWPAADAILADSVDCNGTRAAIRRTPGGGIDWSYRGPDDTADWFHALNDLVYCDTLFAAYVGSGQTRYVERIDTDVRDWILANPCPDHVDITGNWRGIDMAARVASWMQVFYGLQHCDAFSPAARILMLSSLQDHARQLLLYRHSGPANWTIAELKGLAIVGSAWSEFQDAAGWRDYAAEELGDELGESVYPDGAETELSSTYEREAAQSFTAALDVFADFHRPVPDSLSDGVERMWNYLAYTIRPDGTAPQNNDADLQSIRGVVLAAAARFHRDDWAYIATNGEQGEKPATPSTVTFPWAGQTVMRSGWDANAQWAFFDTGPFGTAHQHCDKLHLSIDAFGRALLVDAGRFTNDRTSPYRDYFTSSAAHNVILVDGEGQNPNEQHATAPLSTTEFASTRDWDFARGFFNAGYDGIQGKVIHTRVVVYLHDRFWVVADRIETDRPRAIEALWHYAPDCHVTVDGRSVASDDSTQGNLRITPIGGIGWNVSLVKGSTSPIQGWYSDTPNHKVPESVAVYTAQIPGTTTFAWVLFPARGPVPEVQTTTLSSRPERIEVLVKPAGGASYDITIPMNAWKPTVRRRG